MQITLALLSTVALVAAEAIQFRVLSSSGLNMGYVNSKFINSGYTVGYLANSPTIYEIDSKRLVNQPAPGAPSLYYMQYYRLGDGYVMNFAANGAQAIPVQFGPRNVVTNYQYWACPNLKDPAGFTRADSVILGTASGNNTVPYKGCSKVVLVAEYPRRSSSSSSRSSTSSTWTNTTTTITTTSQVTSYTTYCPLPTVITITSCGTQTCYPVPVTVTTATTITCASCIIPPRTSTVTKTSKATTLSTSTVAPTSKPAVPTTLVNGAGKNAFGVAGIAGVVAFLI